MGVARSKEEVRKIGGRGQVRSVPKPVMWARLGTAFVLKVNGDNACNWTRKKT